MAAGVAGLWREGPRLSSICGRRLSWPLLAALASGLFACFPNVASAQQKLAQQGLPATVAPGQIERQFQAPEAPKSTEEPVAPRGPERQQAPSGAESIRFMLNGLQIVGATVMTPEDLRPLSNELLGKVVTLKQIYELAAEITAKYAEAGYILSQAVVPAQEIAAGVVRIQVIEGYIDHVRIQGENGAPLDRPLVQYYGSQIAESRPLKLADMERYLLLMNDLPGVSARSFLEPSQTAAGAADMVVVVSEKPVSGFATVDNRGTRFVGPYQGMVAANLSDAFGLAERTGVRVINTQPFHDLHYAEFNHQEQLGREGTQLNLTAFASRSHPGWILKSADIDSTDFTGSAEIYHPLIRSRQENLLVRGRFDVEQLLSRAPGQIVSDDRLRVARLAASYDFIDSFVARPAINLVSLESSFGLDFLGATGTNSPHTSRLGAGSDFRKLVANVSRQQQIEGPVSLLMAVTAQYSFDLLPASEEFGFGGTQFGRGYDPSELTGDHGVALKLELQYGALVDQAWLKSYQLYGFYDVGGVWNRVRPAGQPISQGAQTIGVGVRANLTDDVSGNLELGVPLNEVNSPAHNRDPRLFFSMVARF